jgi:chemotaxis protein CheX
MNLHENIVERIAHATEAVFSTMLSMELPPAEASLETGSPEANDGVVSLIGLAGSWAGTGSLTCSPALACRICNQMLMSDVRCVDEEVLDAIAELTNMIIGSVKNDLEVQLGPLGLSIPTVVFGRNFRTRSAGNTEWSVVRFRIQEEFLVVKLCLAPSEKPGHIASSTVPPFCAVEV